MKIRGKRRASLETMGFPGGLRVISDSISTFPKVITLKGHNIK